MLIWISGPTGSGKTSLSELFRKCGYDVVIEKLPETQFADFQADPAQHCAALQEQIMRSRFESWKRLIDSPRIVFDRSIDEDVNVFCQMHFELGLLTEREFSELKGIAGALQGSIPGPDLILFMRPSRAVLSSRVTASAHPEVIVKALDRQLSLYSDWLRNKTAEVLILDNSKCKLATFQKVFSGVLS
jgi:deoxyadenosine/deoxycytidine kinase